MAFRESGIDDPLLFAERHGGVPYREIIHSPFTTVTRASSILPIDFCILHFDLVLTTLIFIAGLYTPPEAAAQTSVPHVPDDATANKRIYEQYALTHAGNSGRGRHLFADQKTTKCTICHKANGHKFQPSTGTLLEILRDSNS